MRDIHQSAACGYEAEAGTYARARPTYHPALVRRFVERYGDGPVIDLGAGTGIFTRVLVDASVQVTAVEPVAAMRQTLLDDVGDCTDVTVADGTAEAIPAGDRTVVTVVAAQAFHWFDHGPALGEIARVLRPGGHLVTVWNVRDESVPWVAEYTKMVDRHAGNTPRHRTMQWWRAIDSDPRFELIDDWHIDHPVPTDGDGVVARALSTSFIAALDASAQQHVAAELRAIVADLGATFDYPYRSELQAWRLIPGHGDAEWTRLG